jgi:hypothetical protein
MVKANEIVCPKKIYRKAQYPNLPADMVKITGKDGRSIFIQLDKLSAMDV